MAGEGNSPTMSRDDRDLPESAGYGLRFQALLQRTRDGCGDAARALYEQYSKPLVMVLRHKYLRPGSPLRRDLDPGDLLQEVWQSVFEVIVQGAEFPGPEEFRRFVLTVGENAARRHYRNRVRIAKRAIGREVPFDPERHDRPAPETSPEQSAAAEEAYRQLLAGASTEGRMVLVAITRGEPPSRIAVCLGVTARTVQRIVRRLRKSARNAFGPVAGSPGVTIV